LKRNTDSQKHHVMQEHPLQMKLEEAKKDPDMINEIYKQVNNAFLSGGSKIEYVASIKFWDQQYNISGTYEDWAFFFGMRPTELIKHR